jgi:lysozyme
MGPELATSLGGRRAVRHRRVSSSGRHRLATGRGRWDHVRLHQSHRGGDFTDDRFEENWLGAREAGLDQGAYHYFTLCTLGADQAHHFLDVAPPESEALPPAVDLELAGNCSARPSPAEVKEQLGEFIRLVEEAWGREVILYVGDDFEQVYPVRQELDRPLWLRRFLLRPDVDGWLIWQLHGYARVDGIDGGVDLDVMRASP